MLNCRYKWIWVLHGFLVRLYSVCWSYATMPNVESHGSICAKYRCSCAPFACLHSPKSNPIMKDILSLYGHMVSVHIRAHSFLFSTTRRNSILRQSYTEIMCCTLFLLHFFSFVFFFFLVPPNRGFFCGGYHYSLRVYLYERVRARNFSQAWSFLQCAQSIPIVVGVNLAEFLNRHVSHKSGYLFGFFCALSGSIILFLVDVHKRNISRHRHTRYLHFNTKWI